MTIVKSWKAVFCWVLVICLLASVIPADTAHAASKPYRREVASQNADGKVYSGKVILTNGTWVYYTEADQEDEKTYIYKVKKDGSGLKKVAAVSSSAELVSLYNGEVYFTVADKQQSKLHSVKLSSGTVLLRNSKFVLNYASGGGRYVYGSYVSASGSNTLKVYDCKEKKINKIVAFKSERGEILTTYNNKVYYYKMVQEDNFGDYNTVTLYRTTLSGTGKRVKTARFEGVNDVAAMVGSKLYYSTLTEKKNTKAYYRYDIETGKVKKISRDTYEKAVD